MKTHSSLLFSSFRKLVKPLIGSGLGRIWPVGALYNFLVSHLSIPEDEAIVEVNGYRMYVHSDRKGIEGIAHELVLTGTYEEYTTAIFKRLVKPGMIVLDIGANIGYFTLLAASLAGEEGKIYAFEPEPRNRALLKRNIEVNNYSNVIVVPKAVTNKTSDLTLFLDRIESGGHSLFRASAQRGNHAPVESVVVQATGIDDFFAGSHQVVDFIKIDVEGAEVLALNGMRATISISPDIKMLTEFTPHKLQNAGNSAREYWEALAAAGFSHIYLVNNHQKRLEKAELEGILKYCRGSIFKQAGHVNLLCSKSPVI